MADHGPEEIGIADALSALRAQVRRTVGQPAASALRRRAERQRRVRRATRAVATAVAVVVIICGVGLARDAVQGPPPLPPVASETATPSASAAPQPRPSRPVPRWTTHPVNDPIAAIDWYRTTIELPAQPGCPSGAVRLRPGEGGVGADAPVGPSGWPRIMLDPGTVVFGDLTGDGRPEAILAAGCSSSEEESGDGEGQLLVVTREGDRLRALGWVGPRGAIYVGWWVAAGRLYLDVHPWHTDWGYSLGAAQAYHWLGGRFVPIDVRQEFPGIVPAAGRGPAVDLAAVSDRTGCPAAVVRFGPDGRAEAGGTTWDLVQPQAPDGLPHLIELNPGDPLGDPAFTPRRRVLVAITCGRPADGSPGDTTAVVLIGPGPDGSLRALDAVRPPADTRLDGWTYRAGVLSLFVAPDGGALREQRWTWNGEYFQ